MSAPVTFKITVPHGPDCSGFGWFLPLGWRGIGPTERRDRVGRAQGEREGYFPEWFVLICNEIDCPGRAAVPVSLVTDHADRLDPAVTR